MYLILYVTKLLRISWLLCRSRKMDDFLVFLLFSSLLTFNLAKNQSYKDLNFTFRLVLLMKTLFCTRVIFIIELLLRRWKDFNSINKTIEFHHGISRDSLSVRNSLSYLFLRCRRMKNSLISQLR